MNEAILIAIIGGLTSAGFFKFLEFLISRKDKRESRLLKIEKALTGIQQGNIRLQLIVLIKLCPDKIEEIMEVAYKYFVDLNGNWYVDSMFDEWCRKHRVEKPSWLIKKEDKK